MAGKRDAEPGKRATLRDISVATGIHTSTISRVLNGDPRDEVSNETRDIVLAAARELRYVPNHSARSLRLGKAGSFGLLVPDITHPTYAALMRGAREEADKSDVVVLIAEVREGKAAQSLGRLIQQQRIDGLLVATGDEDLVASNALSELKLPVVFVNRAVQGWPTVTVDDASGAGLALETLASQGHRDIAIITGPPGIDTADRRRAGFMAHARKAGVPKPVEVCGYFTAEGGAAAASLLFARTPRPTAIFAANLMSGLGALSGAARYGLRVPDDLSLIVFDDAEIADYTVPALTRIKMPWEQMGAAGVQALQRLSSGQSVKSIRIKDGPVLVQRGSVRPAY